MQLLIVKALFSFVLLRNGAGSSIPFHKHFIFVNHALSYE